MDVIDARSSAEQQSLAQKGATQLAMLGFSYKFLQ